jgi:L-ascorbate metabolism protein UlaG (beta-lactamase superfamily)
MDVQFYGANCIVFTSKELRVVIDDNLKALGGKSVARDGDLLLYTGMHNGDAPAEPKMLIDMPGEYEIANLSITGIPARAHMDEDPKARTSTMYKLVFGETSYLITGHIYPELSEDKLEALGLIDVLFVPVGGNGYTLDPVGALKVIKAIEPKLVIPTHYDDKGLTYEVPQQELSTALTELGMEQKEHVAKLKLKPGDLGETTQLLVLERP